MYLIHNDTVCKECGGTGENSYGEKYARYCSGCPWCFGTGVYMYDTPEEIRRTKDSRWANERMHGVAMARWWHAEIWKRRGHPVQRGADINAAQGEMRL